MLSNSISLVGNENPFCRYVACAGYLFDSMQIVQAFGRLRKYMRSSTGQVFIAAPETLAEYRVKGDQQLFTRLLNEEFISSENFSLFYATMTSGGVRDWIMDATTGKKDCALKILSTSFGMARENCGACPKEKVLKMDKKSSSIHIFTRHGWCNFYLRFTQLV